MRWTSSGPSAKRRARIQAYMRASGVSCETPMAPWVCMAWSITSRAISGTATLMPAISVRAAWLPAVSISQAVYIV